MKKDNKNKFISFKYKHDQNVLQVVKIEILSDHSYNLLKYWEAVPYDMVESYKEAIEKNLVSIEPEELAALARLYKYAGKISDAEVWVST